MTEARPISRREARKQDRRDMILTVAQGCFTANGFAGTTMSGIAATLGGSKATLWSHFRSKEDLFAAVLDRVARAYRAKLSRILEAPGELEPTLQRACASFIEKVTSPEGIAIHRLIVADGKRFPEMARIFYEVAPENTRRLLAQFLKEAMDRGQLRHADPMEAARIFTALALSGMHYEMMMGQVDKVDRKRIKSDARLAVDLFLRAYRPEPTA